MNDPRTSESHPIRVDYLAEDVAPFRGRIGLTFAPGKRHVGASATWARDLTVDLDDLLSRYHAGLLISLVEDHELRDLGIEGLVEAAEKIGLVVLRFPFPDGGVPSIELATSAVRVIMDTAVNQGRDVVIHCKGGLGRTGLIAACALVATGLQPRKAIEAVRRARTRAIENTAQEGFVERFAQAGTLLLAEAESAKRPKVAIRP